MVNLLILDRLQLSDKIMLRVKNSILFLFLFISAVVSAQCPTVAISGTHVNCFGGSNGTVTSTITGGSGNFSYSWNTGANSSSISGLIAGIYFVNVTDLVSGCTVFNLFTVNQPMQLTSTLTQQNVKCFGQSTGSIDLTVSGGTSTYSYLWSNSSTAQDISGLAAGLYSVTITDFKGCTATNNTTITQTASAVSSTIVSNNVKCASGSDGSINLTAFGGQVPYTYSWNSGTFISEDINALSSGTYNVVITDALNCTAINGVLVSEPALISSTISGTDVSCFNGSNGFVDLIPSGGTPPYSFNWTSTSFTLGNTEDLTGVIADTYNVTITDANLCTATNNYVVEQPTLLTASISGTNVSCNGYSDGTITLIVNGGSAPYSFVWSTSAGVLSATSQNLTNLYSAEYTVDITDFNGCTLSTAINITQPLLPLIATTTGTNANCYGDNSGTANLTIAGGTLPYQINWSNGTTVEDQSNLFAGNYFVTVVDTNGCLATSNIVITEPLAPLSAGSVTTSANCFGFSDGAIDYSVNGGTAPYSYSWINSQFSLSIVTQDITNFPADTYIITITDSKNCNLSDTSIILQPTQIQTNTLSTNINCFSDATGGIDLTVSGGVPLYNIAWSNNAVTEDITNLTAGKYLVLVTDANGCMHTDSVTLTQPASGLSSSNFVQNTTCYGSTDGYIFYDVQGGTMPYDYDWSNGDSLTNIFNLIAGAYDVTTTDANGCVVTDTIAVDQPQQITILSVANPVTCFGEENGIVDITVSGGTAPYSYQWMNSDFVLSAITQDLINYPSDTYIVTATDFLGCTATLAIPLSEPVALGANVTANNISCAGASDGNIDISLSGGVPAHTFLWSNGATSEDLQNIIAGTYTVTITDANNCVLQQVYTLSEPDPISLSYEVQEVSCSDQHDGEVYVVAAGGTNNYTYLWSNGTTLNPALGFTGGTHSLTITDASGCTKDTTFFVPVNPKECIRIPSAFTPNSDGKNDQWQIENIELYPDCIMKVFNRWGNLLFESKGYLEFWDGKNGGSKLPSETYYYILDLGNEKTPKTGSITLVY